MPVEETQWMQMLDRLPSWSPERRSIAVIAPHPDDETLGCGGLIAWATARGWPITVFAVTDGEAAYPDSEGLTIIRQAEQEWALAELGVSADHIQRLGLPDSRVSFFEVDLADAIQPYLSAETLLIAPWKEDHHPDHDSCGRVAQRLARQSGAQLVSYLFWAWQFSDADPIRSLSLRRFELSPQMQSTKLAALAHHRSQLVHASGNPSLPDRVLAPARRPFEAFVIH